MNNYFQGSYSYPAHRAFLLNLGGLNKIVDMMNLISELSKTRTVFEMSELFLLGSAWDSLACVDFLVEKGFLEEIKQAEHVAGQHRLFKRTYNKKLKHLTNPPATSSTAPSSGTNAVLSLQDDQESAPDRGINSHKKDDFKKVYPKYRDEIIKIRGVVRFHAPKIHPNDYYSKIAICTNKYPLVNGIRDIKMHIKNSW